MENKVQKVKKWVLLRKIIFDFLGFSATTTTSQKKTSKRKSSIPDFFKPRSREQIVTPAKKARKDAGRESSASDSSRPESECPPVEPPFVKGLEAPTIVVDDSNGPITIDETCAEKRRVLHKVKSLKKSRDGAAERRRERLKVSHFLNIFDTEVIFRIRITGAKRRR